MRTPLEIFPTADRVRTLALFVALGTALGFAIAWLGGPMPFMFGGILGAAISVTWLEHRFGPANRRMPKGPRMFFVALAGAMIGATFSPDLLEALPAFWLSALAILPFILIAHLVGYVVMRRVGGFPPVDSVYAAMPGGLIEASILGEKAGADPQTLATQHFVRILLVVMSVPLIFFFITGEKVGSAAGQSLSLRHWAGPDLLWFLGIALAGQALAQAIRMPAGHLMGPLILCGALEAGGVTDLAVPQWLLGMAQLVIGIGLGAQISGLSLERLLRGLGTGVVAVAAMMTVTLGFALLLTPLLPVSASAVFLAFAPGGVTEMSLIALSLQVSPVVVAMHHMIRIVATVLIAQALGRYLVPHLRDGPP